MQIWKMSMSATDLDERLKQLYLLLDGLPFPLVLDPPATGEQLAELADLAGRCQDRVLDLMAGLTDERGRVDAADAAEHSSISRGGNVG